MFDIEFTMTVSDIEFILDISNRMNLSVESTKAFIKDIVTHNEFACLLWWFGNVKSVCTPDELNRYMELAHIDPNCIESVS